MADVAYDDRNLQEFFAELDPKRRMQALKGGFRKVANQVRKQAVGNLRSSIHTDKDLEKGIRAMVFKRKAGFRVTVATKGDKGMHTNRQGLKKPVLVWAELGTQQRRTKDGGGRRAERLRASHSTGRMPSFGFMGRTRDEMRGTMTEEMHQMVAENVQRIARKYGCK